VETAWAPQSVTLLLADDLDVSRGDLIAPAADAPPVGQDVRATVCHLHERPLRIGERVLLKHGTRTVKALVKELPYRIDLSHGLAHQDLPERLEVNDIGTVVLRTAEPLPMDPYAVSRLTGSFLLIDPADGATLTAGMAGEAFAAPVGAQAPAGAGADDGGWDF
jgi:sulfate adenylyltransferase subunit 1